MNINLDIFVNLPSDEKKVLDWLIKSVEDGKNEYQIINPRTNLNLNKPVAHILKHFLVNQFTITLPGGKSYIIYLFDELLYGEDKILYVTVNPKFLSLLLSLSGFIKD